MQSFEVYHIHSLHQNMLFQILLLKQIPSEYQIFSYYMFINIETEKKYLFTTCVLFEGSLVRSLGETLFPHGNLFLSLSPLVICLSSLIGKPRGIISRNLAEKIREI